MRPLNFPGRRRAAGADRPDRLIGDHHLGPAEVPGARAGQLTEDHVQRPAVIPLLLRFADADDRRQTGGAGGRGLVVNQRIPLPVTGAALRMPDDDVGTAQIPQHGRADIAGVRPAPGDMTVLTADGDGRSREFTGRGGDRRRGRANEEFATPAGFRGAAANPTRQNPGVPGETVHFPVSGNQGTSGHGSGTRQGSGGTRVRSRLCSIFGVRVQRPEHPTTCPASRPG